MNPRGGMGRRCRERRSSTFFSWRRVGALLLRHLYVLRRSWPRLLELAYWPTVQMVLWGFVTLFFVQHSTWVAQAAGVLISAVLLWGVLFRSNLGISVTFMEEMWARKSEFAVRKPDASPRAGGLAGNNEPDPYSDQHAAGDAVGAAAVRCIGVRAGIAARCLLRQP